MESTRKKRLGFGTQARAAGPKHRLASSKGATRKALATNALTTRQKTNVTEYIKFRRTSGILVDILGGALTEAIYKEFKITPRTYLELSGPTTQCEQGGAGKVVYYRPGATGNHVGSLKTCTKCYICGLPILVKKTTGMAPECEHVVPVIVAAIYLKLYSGADKGRVTPEIRLVYKWAHEVCNQVKSDDWPLYISRVGWRGGKRIEDENILENIQEGGVKYNPSKLTLSGAPSKSKKSAASSKSKKTGAPSKSRRVGMSKQERPNITVKVTKTKGKSLKLLTKALPQVQYIDGDYNLKDILNGPQPAIHPPGHGAPTRGEIISVNAADIDNMLSNIWDTDRNHSSYIKAQFRQVFGNKENFIACRRNHLINVYQEISDHINRVQIGGHALGTLMTLAGMACLEPQIYRPDDIYPWIQSEMSKRNINPALAQAEASALVQAAQGLVALQQASPRNPMAALLSVAPPPSPAMSRSGSVVENAELLEGMRELPTVLEEEERSGEERSGEGRSGEERSREEGGM